MGIFASVAANWFDLLQSAGIIAGLIFTAHSLRSETKARRVANLMSLVESHRRVWSEFYREPELERVLDENADAHPDRTSRTEEIFVNFVILHLSAAFYAQRTELVFRLEGLRRDISWFFSLPIPRAVWEKTKTLQNDEFVEFVEACQKQT
jgi:hypothetical protein